MVNNTPTIRIDYPLTSIVGTFITNNGSVPDFPSFCPANDCIWPDFNTLAICGSCVDVSELLTFTCRDEPGDWRNAALSRPRDNFTTPHYPTRNMSGLPSTKSCGYFLNASSDQPMLMNGYVINARETNSTSEAMVMRQLRMNLAEADMSYWGGSYSFKNLSAPLLDFITVASADAASVRRNATPVATECALRWCVQTVAASFSNGTYKETIKAVHENNTYIPNLFAGYPNLSGPADQVMHIFTQNLTTTVGGEDFVVPNVTAFQGVVSFSYYMPQYITNASYPMQASFNDKAIAKSMSQVAVIGSSPWLPPNNITQYVDDFATALTRTMRTYPNTTERVLGTGATETYINVNWNWLLMPITLLLATLTFLVCTIVKANGKDVGIWKTSILAVLLHGFTDEARQQFRASWSLLETRDRAVTYSVRFGSKGEDVVQQGKLFTSSSVQRTWST